MIQVEFFATIRELTGEKKTAVAKTPSVSDLLRLLSERYGSMFREEVLPGEEVSDDVTILVNGMHIASTGGLGTPLSDGDEVAIFPIVGGG